MTIKWGPAQDHHLLLKILETHPNIKVECEKVAEAWCQGPDQPTPRAIKERLFNIRKMAKIRPSGARQTPAATNGVNRTAPGSPISATPAKNGKASNGLPTPSSSKVRCIAAVTMTRKRRSFSISDDAELTDESDMAEYPEDVSTFFRTPSKSGDKMRLRAVPPKKYTVEGGEEVGDVASDDSDFNPNAERKKQESKARRRRGIVDDSSDEC